MASNKNRKALLICLLAFIIAVPAIMRYTTSLDMEEDILGYYQFDECLYMNPLSSFMPVKGFMPYIYGVGEDSLVIADTETGRIERLSAQYLNTPVAEDEFSSKVDLILSNFPDLSNYRLRRLRAVFSSGAEQRYRLYQMGNEIWLVHFRVERLWSIYRLTKTDITEFSDLEGTLSM